MTELNRSLGRWQLAFYGIGTMVGAGIYVLVGKVAGLAGQYTPAAFLLSALIVAFSAYSYAQMVQRYPRSAGEAVYVQAAFAQPWLSTLVGSAILLTGVVSAATLSRGFSGYFIALVPMESEWVICGVIAVLVAVACWGVKQSVAVAIVITVIELGGIVAVIVSQGPEPWSSPEHLHFVWLPADTALWPGIFAGVFLAFYAFIGFEDMVNMAEETKQVEKAMPVAISVALLGTTVLYVLVALVAITSLPLDRLAASDAPFLDLVAGVPWLSKRVMATIAMLAIINGALVQVIMGGRVIYGMATKRWFPQTLAAIHPKTQTPVRATILVGLFVLLFALSMPLVTLAKITSGTILLVFAIVNVAAGQILLSERRYSGVGLCACGCLCCLGLLMFQLLS